MKEHRVRTLRVTTTNSINKRDGDDMFSSLQLLRLELELRPGGMTPLRCLQQPTQCCRLGHHHHHHGDQKSSNSILQECLSCQNVPMIGDLLISANTEINSIKSHKCDGSAALHFACTLPTNVPFLHKLCTNGSDVTRLYANCQTALQLLLTGDLQGNWESVLEATELLAGLEKERRVSSGAGILLSATDGEGNTPLLIAGRRLLKEGAFERAAHLGRLLLEAGSDPDAVNSEGRSLLSYSVHHMDDSVELTRTLLNGGASVWPVGNVENPSAEQCSAFAWFLRAVIRRRKLDERCGQTLGLISEVMGEHPGRMHGHVMRTMFRHAKCYKVLGPVFYQLKISMMRYWTQPLDLRFMCRRTIRSAIGSEQCVSGGACQLGLPARLERYITLE